MAVIKGLHAYLIKEQVEEAMNKLGYAFFDGARAFNLNIIGIRAKTHRANKFDDTIMIIYRNKVLEWEVHTSQATTDPGLHHLRNPSNVKGTAILVPGQYRSTYQLGDHKGNPALVQWGGKVKVYRDRNKDGTLNMRPANIDEGYFGINIHQAKSKGETYKVDRWSAGCQVFKNATELKSFLVLCKKAEQIFGNSFTYSLLEEKDLT